jgi:p-aminobenzoyl-glutamate transporter AbgT
MKNKKIEKHSLKNKNYINKINKILQSKASLIILILVLVIFFVLSKINAAVKKTQIEKEILPKAVKKILRNDNANIEINNLKETHGIYEFQLTLKEQNNQKFISYITKDGKILFNDL